MYYEIFSSSTPKLFTPNDIPIDIKSFFLSQQPTMQGEKMNIQPLYDATVIVNDLQVAIEILANQNKENFVKTDSLIADLKREGFKVYKESSLKLYTICISLPLSYSKTKVAEEIAKNLEENGLKVQQLKIQSEKTNSDWHLYDENPLLIACDNFCN